MDKRKAFYAFAEITTRQNRGAYWVNLLQTYFNPEKILLYSGMIKILVPVLDSKILLVGAAIFFFLMEFVKYYIGKLDEKMGLWKKQNEYNQKKEHLNPMLVEIRETLKNIAEKVGAKSEFKDL